MNSSVLTEQSPIVSIIIVNLNGQALLPSCLDALVAQSYPQIKTEIILIDNGSTDDSVVQTRENYPTVQVVEIGRNLGFAGGNNAGAEVSHGQFLALINNDAIADVQWLSTAMNAFQTHPDIDCVASKLLNADGTAIDFVETGLNLFGRAFQLEEHLPVDLTARTAATDTFAPSGGAMVIRRDVFLRLGGFDEDFIAYYEDVDLGWRLWLAGYKTLFVPESMVYHHKHQTGTSFANEQRSALSEMNAFRALIKNLDDENLWKTLSFATLAAVKRLLNQTQISRESYRFGAPRPAPGDAPPTESMPRVAVSILVALDAIADELPRLMEKRRRVQAMRKLTDAEIFTQFPLHFYNPIFSWREFNISQQTMVKAMAFPTALQPVRGNHLLIITHEVIGKKMAGPGIRAWEMARALSASVSVTLASLHPPQRTDAPFRLTQFHAEHDFADLKPLIDAADVVLAMGPLFIQIECLQLVGKPVIVDLYDPFELEKLANLAGSDSNTQLRSDIAGIHAVTLQGMVGDFFICANERQRDFWLGTLLAAGRVNSETYAQDATMRRLIDVVPFGIPAEPPEPAPVLKGVHPQIASDDILLLWNGGLWQWFDPLLLLDALAAVVKIHKSVKLYFAAGVHFDATVVPEMPIYHQTVERAKSLGLLNTHVFFGDWIPYEKRGAFLLEADAVVSIHCPGIETYFSSRTRLYDCIWAGVPVISTAGDPISELMEQHGLGKTVPSGDVSALADAILAVVDTPPNHLQIQQASEALRPQFLWQNVVKPITHFMKRAKFAPDALTAVRRANDALNNARNIERLIAERNALHGHLAMVEQGRVMKFLNTVNKFLGQGNG